MDALLHWLNGEGAILLARIGLVILFPFSALHKLFFRQEAMQQAASSVLPGAAVLLILAGTLEVVGSALIVLGVFDRLAAFLMAGYCVVTAFFFHRFWLYPDLLSQGQSEGRTHLFDFFKNFGLAGGFLLLILVTQFQTLGDFARAPRCSRHRRPPSLTPLSFQPTPRGPQPPE